VHGVHDNNGGTSKYQASEEVLRGMIWAVVQRGIGATFFNTASYKEFTVDPVRIELVARLLAEANAGTL